MKVIKKDVCISQPQIIKVTVYQADDGTEFTDKLACENWEKALKEKKHHVLASRIDGFVSLNGNGENDEVILYHLRNKEDHDFLLNEYKTKEFSFDNFDRYGAGWYILSEDETGHFYYLENLDGYVNYFHEEIDNWEGSVRLETDAFHFY